MRREGREYGADDPIFAGGVHRLEDEDHAFFTFGIKLLLLLVDDKQILNELVDGLFPVIELPGVGAVKASDVETALAFVRVISDAHNRSPFASGVAMCLLNNNFKDSRVFSKGDKKGS